MDDTKCLVELPVYFPSGTTDYYDPMEVASIESTTDPERSILRLKGFTENGGSFIPLSKEKIAELLGLKVVAYNK